MMLLDSRQMTTGLALCRQNELANHDLIVLAVNSCHSYLMSACHFFARSLNSFSQWWQKDVAGFAILHPGVGERGSR